MGDTHESADLLIHNLGLVCDPDPANCAVIHRHPGAGVEIRDGRIAALWPADGLPARLESARREGLPLLDGRGALLLPGFVDCHTHPVFNEGRAGEYEQRNAGRSYLEIQQAGGGILSFRRSLQQADPEQLEQRVRARLRHFLRLGTTTVEAKSGYGLSVEHELLSLRLLKRLAARETDLPRIHPTLLAAHSVPPEFHQDRAGWFRVITEQILPVVVQEGLAEAFDAFCEPRVITVEECEPLLRAAREAGLGIHLHADQLESGGGGELAARLGALSADHLENIDDAGIRALAQAGTTCVLLPGSTLFLGLDDWAPARRILAAGGALALATDYNPGSSHLQSMPLVLTLATCRLKLTAEEAVWAATAGGARALARSGQVGCLAPGAWADLCLWPFTTLEELPYTAGDNRPAAVLLGGGSLFRTLIHKDFRGRCRSLLWRPLRRPR